MVFRLVEHIHPDMGKSEEEIDHPMLLTGAKAFIHAVREAGYRQYLGGEKADAQFAPYFNRPRVSFDKYGNIFLGVREGDSHNWDQEANPPYAFLNVEASRLGLFLPHWGAEPWMTHPHWAETTEDLAVRIKAMAADLGFSLPGRSRRGTLLLECVLRPYSAHSVEELFAGQGMQTARTT